MKKTTKLHIFIFVLLVAVMAILPIFATNSVAYAATEAATISVSSATVHRGQTFTVDVTIENNRGLTGLGLILQFNRNVMRLKEVTKGDALSSMTYQPANPDQWDNLTIKFLWDSLQQDKSNGLLLTLEFESFINAPVGEEGFTMYPITFVCDENNTRSDYGVPATVAVEGAEIEMIKGKFVIECYNYDGTKLWEQDYNTDEAPNIDEVYDGPAPTREADEMYTYVWTKHWIGMRAGDTSVIKYMAEYELIPKEYSVYMYVDGKLVDGRVYDYGEKLALPKPFQKNYTFVGWFEDESFKDKFQSTTMPSHDLRLYGYQKYNIREENIPVMQLDWSQQNNTLINVDVMLTSNTGISNMKVTLDYDHQNLALKGFKRGEVFSGAMDFTNGDKIEQKEDGFYREKEKGVLSVDPFSFQLDNSNGNSFETGLVLTLQFEIAAKAPNNVYDVTFSYNRASDIVYINELGEIWYTDIDITKASIPVGKKDHWEEPVAGDENIKVDVTSDVAMTVDTQLIAEDVTDAVQISDEQIVATAGENKEIKKVYEISLIRGNEEVRPEGSLEVKIKLSQEDRKSKGLKLYTVNENGALTAFDSHIVGDELVFRTDNLTTYAIMGDVQDVGGAGGGMDYHIYIIAGMAVVIMVLIVVLIVVAKRGKKKY